MNNTSNTTNNANVSDKIGLEGLLPHFSLAIPMPKIQPAAQPATNQQHAKPAEDKK